MSKKYRIAVAGFGVAGAAISTLLANAGHTVTVFEQANELLPVGHGVMIQVSGQIVLNRLGILSIVTAQSEPLDGLHVQSATGRTFLRLRYEDAMPGYRGYGVARPVLMEALLFAAQRAGVEIKTGVEIGDWFEEDEGIELVSGNADLLGRFDFMVVADGSRSRLRARSFPLVKVKEYDYAAFWVTGKSTKVLGHLRQVVYGSERLLGILPVGGGNCTLFWGLHKSAMEGTRIRGVDDWCALVEEYCPEAHEILSDVYNWERVTPATYRRCQLDNPYHKRAVFIGDAAHSMSPHLGQGANLALMDAAMFADALESTQTIQEAAVALHRAQQGMVSHYYGLSRMLTPFFQTGVTPLVWGRDIALPIMNKIPPIRNSMTRSMAGVKQGWIGTIDYKELLPATVKRTEKVPG
jgi:2-polyprenyl-6-methoxyphenol hydroxylase-like FAD-dependent oxidoreductase